MGGTAKGKLLGDELAQAPMLPAAAVPGPTATTSLSCPLTAARRGQALPSLPRQSQCFPVPSRNRKSRRYPETDRCASSRGGCCCCWGAAFACVPSPQLQGQLPMGAECTVWPCRLPPIPQLRCFLCHGGARRLAAGLQLGGGKGEEG